MEGLKMHTRVYFEPFFARTATEVAVSYGINFHEKEKYYHLHAYVNECPLIAKRGTAETAQCILISEFDEWLKTKNCYVNVRSNSVILIFRDTIAEAEFRLRWC